MRHPSFHAVLLSVFLFVSLASALDRLDPAVYICSKPEQVFYKEPLSTAPPVGMLKFGMPIVVLVRHQDWFGIYTPGGNKGWLPSSSVLMQYEFQALYPYIALNDEAMKKLLAEAGGASSKKSEPAKEILVQNKGETEEVYVHKDNMKIRSKPMHNSLALREAFQGEAFKVVNMIRGWYRVEYDEGKFGWLAEECAWPDTTQYSISLNNDAGVTKSAFAYIQGQPASSAPIIAKAKKGFIYEILGEQGNWLKVRLDSLRTGWVQTADIRVVRQGQKTRQQATATAQAPAVAPVPAPVPAKPAAPAPVQTPAAPAPAPAPAVPAAPAALAPVVAPSAPAPVPTTLVAPPSPSPQPSPSASAAPTPPLPPPPELAFSLPLSLSLFKTPRASAKPFRAVYMGNAFMVEPYNVDWARLITPAGDTCYALLRALGKPDDLYPAFTADPKGARRLVAAVAFPAAAAIHLFKGPSARFGTVAVADEKDTLFIVRSLGGFHYVVSTHCAGWASISQLVQHADLNRLYKGKPFPAALAPKVQVLPKLTRDEFVAGLTVASPAELLPLPEDDALLLKTYQAKLEGLKAIVKNLLENKGAEVASQIKKRDECDQLIATATADSVKADSLARMRQAAAQAQLDTQRVLLNNRFALEKDSLIKEKNKLEQATNSSALVAKLKEEQKALSGEVNILKYRAKDTRERAKNLKELAKVEFDIDTSARAKDSMLKYAAGCDSMISVKELKLFRLEGEIATWSSLKPEEIPVRTARVDSAMAQIPLIQKAAAMEWVQKQQALEASAAQMRMQALTAPAEKLAQLRKTRLSIDSLLKQLSDTSVTPEKILEEKRTALKASLVAPVTAK